MAKTNNFSDDNSDDGNENGYKMNLDLLLVMTMMSAW